MDKRLQDVLKSVEAATNFRPGSSEASAIDTTLPPANLSEVPLHKLAENNPGVPRIGLEAASKMQHLSSTAGADIRQLGDLAIRAAEEIRDKCYQMADDVEANGAAIATSLKGFAHLLADIGMSNRATHSRLLRGDPIPQPQQIETQPTEVILTGPHPSYRENGPLPGEPGDEGPDANPNV